MIVGIGVDVVAIERLGLAFARHPGLRERLFAPEEIDALAGQGDLRSLAARFAAKEAARKAVGGAAGRTRWRDAVVLGGRGGPPRLELRGGLLEAAWSLGATRWHVSLTHEREYAVAMVVIES